MNAHSPAVAANLPIVVTLFTGLLIAFAVQLLLTSFGAAVGITALGYLPIGRSASTQGDADPDGSEEEESKVPGVIGIAVGLGTLVTVNLVLFIACFLAVKLSLVTSAVLGAILGLVIWAGYFLVVVWVGSSAVGSLLGSIASTLTAGVQGLISTTSAVFGRKDAALPQPLRKQMAAAEAILQGLQGELKQTQDDRAALQDTWQATLQEYVTRLQPPKPDLATLRQEFSHALRDSDQPLATEIDRPALVELVSRRTDFSKQDVHQIVSELETVWREALGGVGTIAALTPLLASAHPQELTAETLKPHLQPHLQAATPGETAANPAIDPKQLFKQLVRTVRQRVDLSDLDVGQVVQRLQSLLSSDSEPNGATSIGADVEEFLLNAHPWQLSQKTLQSEFEPVIFDPEANPIVMRQQLEELQPEDLAALLHQRDDLDEAQVSPIVDCLETVRQQVLETVRSIESQQQSQSFVLQVTDYLQSAQKSDLKPAPLKRQLIKLLHQSGAAIEQWADALQPLDSAAIQQALQAHASDSEQLAALTEPVVTVRDRLIQAAQTPARDRQARAEALWLKLEKFVRNPEQKLTARTIQRQFKALGKAAEEFPVQRPFDRSTVEQWLNDRQNLSAKRMHQIADQLEKAWNNLVDEVLFQPSPPGRALQVLTDYLKNLDGSRLDLATFPQDLLTHLRQHQVGLGDLGLAVASRWGTIESLQPPNLSAEQIQQLQQSIYALAKLPRRWAVRTQGKAASLWDSLTHYLRHADPADLDPAHLQSSLNYLAKVAPTQLRSLSESLGDAIPDQESLVAFLVDRGDLTATEAEKIGRQVAATLQKAIEQAQTLKQQSQQAIDRTLNTFNQALAAIELPSLDVDRLKQDLQNLVADPQAHWETLNTRLSSFNRDAIAQLLQTRDDLSESVVSQLVDRVDAVRLSLSQQVSQLQQEAEQRLEDLKQQAQNQAIAAQKAVAIAAWWLFSTAATAATTAAIAGALAADGLNWLPHWLPY